MLRRRNRNRPGKAGQRAKSFNAVLGVQFFPRPAETHSVKWRITCNPEVMRRNENASSEIILELHLMKKRTFIKLIAAAAGICSGHAPSGLGRTGETQKLGR